MAVIFIEGFDKYGSSIPNANVTIALLTQGEWTTASGPGSTPLIVAGLSSTGSACQFSGASASKTLPANYPRLIGGFRFNSTLSGQAGIQLQDGVTAQASIRVSQGTGLVSLIQGGSAGGGTVLGSSAPVTANTTHYVEFDITFSPTGAYQVWLDGVLAISGTGDTTGTANNYANVFGINTSVGVFNIDDIYLFDATGTTNNAPLLTSPRIETTFPVADSAVQFAFGAGILGNSVSRGGTATGIGSNQMRVKQVTPLTNCTISSVSILSSSNIPTVQLRSVVYSDNAGLPNSLLNSGPTLVGVSGLRVLPLTTPVNLTGGVTYWVGYMHDIATTSSMTADAGGSNERSAGATFASGAPATFPASSGAISTTIWGNLTAMTGNWPVSTVQPPQGASGAVNYIFDTVVGHEDLYSFGAFRYPPLTVYTSAVKAYVSRSDSGTRTVSMRMKSGATDSGGSLTGQTAGPSFTWLGSYFDLDPNGNIAWTTSALNAATSGLKIDS